jgi:hypothetical protein
LELPNPIVVILTIFLLHRNKSWIYFCYIEAKVKVYKKEKHLSAGGPGKLIPRGTQSCPLWKH